MSSLERNLFLMPQGRGQISKQEAEKLAEKPHSELLAEAFDVLCHELEANGNISRFHQLREEYARKLITYWQSKRDAFEKAKEDGKLQNGELVCGDEHLLVESLGVYGSDDEAVLHIRRKTEKEEDEVYITVSRDTGLDEFLSPPKIKSEIRTDPQEAPDIFYEVIFRKGRISTFKRTIFRVDSEHYYPAPTDTRVIDCSMFGL